MSYYFEHRSILCEPAFSFRLWCIAYQIPFRCRGLKKWWIKAISSPRHFHLLRWIYPEITASLFMNSIFPDIHEPFSKIVQRWVHSFQDDFCSILSESAKQYYWKWLCAKTQYLHLFYPCLCCLSLFRYHKRSSSFKHLPQKIHFWFQILNFYVSISDFPWILEWT